MADFPQSLSTRSEHEPGEADRLFEVIRDLKSRGVSIIYISHRLGEVRALADRVIVLRDGRNAGELQREQITHSAMVGAGEGELMQMVGIVKSTEELSVSHARGFPLDAW